MKSAQRFELVSPDRPLIANPVDWSICFICQEEGDESFLVFPYKKPGEYSQGIPFKYHAYNQLFSVSLFVLLISNYKYRPVFVFHDICQINCKLNNNEKQQDVFKILLLYIHFPGFAKDPTKSSYYSTAENLKNIKKSMNYL